MPDPVTPAGDDTLSPVPLPEQPPMDDAAGGPQADDPKNVEVETGPPADRTAPHVPVTD